jgi:hypothetical protein
VLQACNVHSISRIAAVKPTIQIIHALGVLCHICLHNADEHIMYSGCQQSTLQQNTLSIPTSSRALGVLCHVCLHNADEHIMYSGCQQSTLQHTLSKPTASHALGMLYVCLHNANACMTQHVCAEGFCRKPAMCITFHVSLL